MDLLLDRDTHDLVVENYDLNLSDGLQLVEQRLRQSLWFFFGEWFLDITDGVPYYEDILVKAPIQITVESILKDTILATPGVLKITQFDVEYTNSTRNLTLDFAVSTDFGNLEISEDI